MYVGLMTKILFVGLLIVRGLNVKFPFAARLEKIIKAMSYDLGIFNWAMYPCKLLLEMLAAFNIDLSSVNVTCLGAQAPLEYFVNISVFLTIVIFIESGIHETLHVHVLTANENFLEVILNHGDMVPSTWSTYLTISFALLFQAVNASSPVLKFLQLLTGIVRFSVFVPYHLSSSSCDKLRW